MLGINLEKFEQLTKISGKLLSESADSLAELETSVNSLSDCYIGYSHNSIYSLVKNQNNNLTRIDSVLNSYFTMLDAVKNTYIKQDALFGDQLGSVIKKF